MDLPSILSTQPIAGTGLAPAISVPVAVTAVPDSLLQLIRILETQGQITIQSPALLNAQTTGEQFLNITVPQGNVTLALPQGKETPAILATIQELQSQQKPVSILIQPGSPPTQAIIILPQPTTRPDTGNTGATSTTPITPQSINRIDIPAQSAARTAPIPPTLTFTPGLSLNSVVLPTISTTRELTTSVATTPAIQPHDVEQAIPSQNRIMSPALPAANTTQSNTPSATSPPTLLAAGITTTEAIARFQNAPTTSHPQAILTLHQKIPDGMQVPTTQPTADSKSAVVATSIGTTNDGHTLFEAGRNLVIASARLTDQAGTRYLATLTQPPASASTPSAQSTSFNPGILAEDAPELAKLYAQLLPTALSDDSVNPDEGMVAARNIENLLQLPAGTVQPHNSLAQLPRVNAALPASLLFFLAATQSGGALGWVDDAGLGALLKRNKSAIDAVPLRERSKSPIIVEDMQGETWQRHSVPILQEGQWQFVHFFVHPRDQNPAPHPNKQEAPRVRFLVDLQLTKIGAMQIDGLSHHKRLDLILRSASRLPDALTTSLQSQYNDTLQALGMHGVLSVEAGTRHWTRFRNRMPPDRVI